MKMNKLVWIVMLVVFASVCYAGVNFYSGNMIIEKVVANIDLSNEIEVEYDIFEPLKSESVFISFSENVSYVSVEGYPVSLPAFISIKKDEKQKISISYLPVVNKERVKSFNFNPKIWFNNNLNPNPVSHYELNVILPQGATNLINPPDDYVIDEVYGRVRYSWKIENAYLTSLKFQWSISDADIALKKDISFDDDIVNVKLVIQNKGLNDLDEIVLKDYFFPAKFESVSPLDEFDIYIPPEGTIANEEIIWNKVISLRAGESKEIEYRLRDLDRTTDSVFNPTTVFVDGLLVSTSNQIIEEGERPDTLQKMVDAQIEKRINVTDYPEPSVARVGKGKIIEEELVQESALEDTELVEKDFTLYYIVVIVLVLIILFFWFRKRSTLKDEKKISALNNKKIGGKAEK